MRLQAISQPLHQRLVPHQNKVSTRNTFTEYNPTLNNIAPKNATTKEEINLRENPSTDSNIIYTLKNGEYITKVA